MTSIVLLLLLLLIITSEVSGYGLVPPPIPRSSKEVSANQIKRLASIIANSAILAVPAFGLGRAAKAASVEDVNNVLAGCCCWW